jgi:hypothetical protein
MPKKRKYPRTIANWPAEERPREKLLLKGPDALSDISRMYNHTIFLWFVMVHT